MGIISKLERQQEAVATYLLHDSQGQTSLTVLKYSYVQQPLTI